MLKPGIIVSCQASEGNYLDTYVLCQMARSALLAEPAGLRLSITTAQAIFDTKAEVSVPIIGLTKKYFDGLVHITSTAEDAKACEDAGCEYVATDGTGRWGYDEMKRMLRTWSLSRHCEKSAPSRSLRKAGIGAAKTWSPRCRAAPATSVSEPPSHGRT